MRHSISALCLPFLLVLGLGAVANSADLKMETDKESSVSVDGWNGAYFGIHGSKIWSQGGIELDDNSGALIPLDIQNGLFFREKRKLRGTFTGGITVGNNRQIGNFVFGIEGDITPSSLKVRHTRSRIDPNPVAPFTGQQTLSDYNTEFGPLGTLRLRAGMTFNQTMVYLTAGLAGGEVKNSFGVQIPGLAYTSPDWSKSGLTFGYTLGAGIEHKLTDGISIKAEGLFVDLKDRIIEGYDPVSFPGEHISYLFENKMIIGRVGLNFAF